MREKGTLARKRAYYWVAAWCLAILIGGAGVYAVTVLTQVTPVVAKAILQSPHCPSPTQLNANQTYFVAGFTNMVRLTCTADGYAYQTQGGIVGTPTFSLPSGVTALWSYQSSTTAGAACSAGTGAWQMTSGSAHTFATGSVNWELCMVISNTANADISNMNIVWSA